MKVLILAEHDGHRLRAGSLSCFTFATQVADATGGDVAWLILGDQVEQVARHAASFAPVLTLDSPLLANPLADSFACSIATIVQQRKFDLVCAASSTFSKDILPRAAALLGGAMAGDVIRHELTDAGFAFDCPQFAGAITATVRLIGSPQIVSVRRTAYSAAVAPQSASHSIERLNIDSVALASRCEYVGLNSKKSNRPDVSQARVVVAGGRAIKTRDDFEQLVGRLADTLHGTVACSRALVDTGVAPNELQIGQTGKIVAPDLYLALGISGAVQHVAGMKNSRTVVAINNDPDAPIFDVSDFGIVGDVYQIVPELIDKLQRRSACTVDGP